MKILFFGGYQKEYSRVQGLMSGLRKCGVVVQECHFPLGEGLSFVSNLHKFPQLLCRMTIRYIKLLLEERKNRDYEIIFVPFNAFYDVPLAKFIAKLRGKKLIFDPLISQYDTYVFNKPVTQEGSLRSCLYKLYDKLSFSLPDIVLLDTDSHIQYISELLNIKKTKFRKIPIGSNEDVFNPDLYERSKDGFKILWYGRTSKLHGVEYIIQVAQQLKEYKDIKFTIIGGLTNIPITKVVIENLKNTNTTFVNWKKLDDLSLDEIPKIISQHDVCLGCFGATEKAKNVIINKEVEALAMRKPLITRDKGKVNEILISGYNCLLCKPADAKDLAKAILKLYHDRNLRNRLAENGYLTFLKFGTTKKIAEKLVELIKQLRKES